jgi:Ca2+-binding RTX toxin-like protein
VASLLDGNGTIESGEVELSDNGDIKIELESVETGTAFILINQADTNNNGGRDFVFSGSFTLSGGEVEMEFSEAIPVGTSMEDLLVTLLLDTGDPQGIIDENDTILAVPGFTIEEEPEEFEAEGTVSNASGDCPDVTFMVNGTQVIVDNNTEYEDGTCEDLFGDDVQVKVEGIVNESGNLATKVEFISDTPEVNEIYCLEGQPCIGTDGDDIIYGTSGPDKIYGGNGSDIIYGDSGDDYIGGGNGEDIIFGEGGNDVIIGGNGRDELDGGEGDDELRGENGSDTLDGGLGADDISGGNGSDTINCDKDDTVDGGRGNDNIDC